MPLLLGLLLVLVLALVPVLLRPSPLLQLLMPYRIATVHGVRVCAPAAADGEASCL